MRENRANMCSGMCGKDEVWESLTVNAKFHQEYMGLESLVSLM